MTKWKSLVLAVGLNLLIPYLGNVLFRPRRYVSPLLFATTLEVLVAVTENNVVAGSLYVRHVAYGIMLLLAALFVHSSYLCFQNRDGVSIDWQRAALLTFCIALIGGFVFLYDARSLKVAAGSLDPIVPRDSIVATKWTTVVDRGKVAAARDAKTNLWRVGIVLARPGDVIGLVERIPVSCPKAATENTCFRVDDYCLYHITAQPPIVDRAVLSSNEILLATSIRGPDRGILSRKIVFADTHPIARIFHPDRWLDFGTQPVVRGCPT